MPSSRKPPATPTMPTVRTAKVRLEKMLAEGKPCPLCNARSLLDGSLAGIAVPKRYAKDAAMHVGWHFKSGQPVTETWWGVACVAGLLMLAESEFLTGVPQLDELVHQADHDTEGPAIQRASRFVRAYYELISRSGHRAFFREVQVKELGHERQFWFVEPSIWLMARDVARGYSKYQPFADDMRAILSTTRPDSDTMRDLISGSAPADDLEKRRPLKIGVG